MKSTIQIVFNSDRVHVCENGTPVASWVWFDDAENRLKFTRMAKANAWELLQLRQANGFTVEVLPDQTK